MGGSANSLRGREHNKIILPAKSSEARNRSSDNHQSGAKVIEQIAFANKINNILFPTVISKYMTPGASEEEKYKSTTNVAAGTPKAFLEPIMINS